MTTLQAAAQGTAGVFHSDRGSQYASQDFRDILAQYGIQASMSRRGNCWDIPLAFTLHNSFVREQDA